jgi:hypothetical protein
MKTKNVLCGLAMAFVLQLGVLAGSAQTNIYLFSGSKSNITLNRGLYPPALAEPTQSRMVSTEQPRKQNYE